MDFRPSPKDNCSHELPVEQQNTASEALESINRDLFDEISSVVEMFPV